MPQLLAAGSYETKTHLADLLRQVALATLDDDLRGAMLKTGVALV